MLTVEKHELENSQLELHIGGTIEENTDLNKDIGDLKGYSKIYVYTKSVPRINSVGVKGWIRYFQALTQGGTELIFRECSTAIVEQFNLISNFGCGGKVESLYLPFVCQGCGTELVGLFTVQQIRDLNYEIPNIQSPRCQDGEAEFDDLPDEYFNFLMQEDEQSQAS